MFAALPEMAEEATALIAELLGLSCEAPPKIEQLAPQKRKERTFAALLARIEYLAAQLPIFALVEDVHWVDPTSLEFFALLIQRASKLRIFLVVVGRPEFVSPWSNIRTGPDWRLARSDSALLVAHVTGRRRLAAAVEADIIARADGVPLFIEELTKSVLESNETDTGSGQTFHPCPGAPSIPATLQGLLLSTS